MTFSFKVKKINLAELAVLIQKVYNAYNKEFKKCLFLYIFYRKKINFYKKTDISLRETLQS